MVNKGTPTLSFVLYTVCAMQVTKMKVQTIQKRSCYFRKKILNFPGTCFKGYETLYLLKFTPKDCLLNPNILSGCVVCFKDIYCPEYVYSLLTTRYRFWKIKRWDREEERALDSSITEWDRYVCRADPGIIFMSLFSKSYFFYRQLSDVCSSKLWVQS